MGFKNFCKKICKEICRPFRQASRGMGRLARHVGGKKFGDFIERALNIAIDAALNVGSATFGGPAGVAAINALLAASYNLSDKDILKAAIIGGASAFCSILSSELVAAKNLGIQTIMATTIINGSLAAASGQNIVNGIAYGFGGLICPGNPLLVAAMKTIAEKDIEAGLLHVVGFETGQYLQSYINVANHIEKHNKGEDKLIFGPNKKNVTPSQINKSIKKDVELYNFIKNEMIEPLKESVNLPTHTSEVKHKFVKVYEKVNKNTWELKTRIAMKTNELNATLVYKIHPESGLAMTANINKHLGIKTSDTSFSAGLSSVYPRGFVVTYGAFKDLPMMTNLLSIDNNTLTPSFKFMEHTNKGTCYTTKTYNENTIDSVKMTSEYHVNADCIAATAVGATIAVIASQTIPAMATSLLVPLSASASVVEATMVNNTILPITLGERINSCINPKLNFKLGEQINDPDVVNKIKIPQKSPTFNINSISTKRHIKQHYSPINEKALDISERAQSLLLKKVGKFSNMHSAYNDHGLYDKPAVATQGYHVETIKVPISKSTNVVIGAGYKGLKLNGDDIIGVAILSHETDTTRVTGSIARNISDNVSFGAAKIQIRQELGEKTNVIVSGETQTTSTHTLNIGKVIVEHNINDKTRIQLGETIQDNLNHYTNKESCLSIDHKLGELSSIGGKICHKNSPQSDDSNTEFKANIRINF